MSSQHIQELVPNAEIVSKQQALIVNTAAAVGLQSVLQSNLGPTGTLKLLVGGTSTQLKLTKDGYTLLKEMQIQHPVAALIARTATAQDDITGDGTTSTVLLIGELLKQCAVYTTNSNYSTTANAGGGTSNTIHPRIITDGLDLARDAALNFLKTKFALDQTTTASSSNNASTILPVLQNRELLLSVARTSLGTKLDAQLVTKMAAAVTDAIQCIGRTPSNRQDGKSVTLEDKENSRTAKTNESIASDEIMSTEAELPQQQQQQLPLDLHRVEILPMQQRSTTGLESKFVNGIVLDHGSRHPDMPTSLHNVYIMICNISLEYEQAETASGFVYSTAQEREALVESERKWLDERCRKIVQFKRSVCNTNTDGCDSSEKKTFCIINQKGVDPLSLDMFAKEGILCLRRAKRRNMERLSLATGGQVILSLEDLDLNMLGYCGHVYEEAYGDDKFTFVEDCGVDAQSCTLLIQGPNQLTIDQIKDAVKDGLRAVKNAVEDNAVVPGGGAFELAASLHLTNEIVPKTIGKAKLGVMAFAEALLIIPKTLIANSGYDVQDALLQLKDEYMANNKPDSADPIMAIGFNCTTGEPMLPVIEGVYDNVRVKRQSLHLATVLANQLLLVDEVMRAGKSMGQQQSQQQPMDDM